MRLSLRFLVPLLLTLAAFAYAVAPLVDDFTLRWAVRDLDMRSTVIAKAIEESLEKQLSSGSATGTAAFFTRVSQDEHLYAVGYCAEPQSKLLATPSVPPEIRCATLDHWNDSQNKHVLHTAKGPLHIAVKPAPSEGNPDGRLVLVQDMSFIDRRSEETRRYLFYFFLGLAATVSLITVIIAQLSWRGWVAGTRALLRGEGLLRRPATAAAAGAAPPPAPEFKSILSDVQRLRRELEAERRSRDESQLTWNPATLRAVLHGQLRGADVIVVSNREPYIHQRRGETIEVQRPSSGLVTALEPVMRACSGVWVAAGSGSADRDTVDDDDRVAVPPENPAYQLRRVWLSAEEEAGHYYGFSNEGLWPLCHIAHVRPTFRPADWAHYVTVNRKFADAVLGEAKKAKTTNPIVLVQDYHFALLPRMLHDALPEATVITFWHIPWPNPESFAICPWAAEILSGMLGSNILGFHTQYHCNNFVDTVDRLLEARVDRESFTVTQGGKLTAVRCYPISIAWPPGEEMDGKAIADCRREIRAANGLPSEQTVGVGVDRLDYTKGIVERFLAIERLFELQPQWIGRFTFIQIAAPTRSVIDEYRNHEAAVRALCERINTRFAGAAPALLLKVEHHEPAQVYEYYRAAELCFVSSLHDGMNLVAKEYVAARDDEQGVLILSQFAGASRELPEALVVNPYDVNQCAAALGAALSMPVDEQRDRMRLMRGLVAEFNVYRWAGRMLLDAALMRRRRKLPESAPANPPP